MSSLIIKRAEELTITSPEELSDAVVVLSSLNKMKDEIETEKVKVTRPLLDALNAERSRWKPREVQLESVITHLRSMITVFQTALVAKQRMQEESIAKRLSDGKILPNTAIKRMDAVVVPESRVETDKGSISFKTVKKFELVDHKLVPNEYVVLNDVAVRKALSEGVELAGVRYWEEQVPVNYR